LKIKSRIQLRKSVKNSLLKEMISLFGEEISKLEKSVFEKITIGEYTIILVDGKPLFIELEGAIYPTVKGALELKLKKRQVVVDKGAIRFVYNGADIMSPGVVEADPEINEGELVIVVEEIHRKPLAVGKALMDGASMVEATSGKAVKSIIHVGDKIWNLEI